MQQVQLLRSGNYQFFITGIIDKDKDGNVLKMKDGQPYKKLRLAVVDRDGYTRNIYDPIFGTDSEKGKQLINCVANEVLKHKFINGNFRLEDLIGTGGFCLIGIRPAKDIYPAQNNVECYLQRGYGYLAHNSGDTDKWKAEPKRQELVSSDVAEDLELVEDSEIPF